MKSKLLSFITLALLSQLNICYGQNNIAQVKKIQGFYIFTDSEPMAEYDVVGEITTKSHNDSDIINSGGQYQPVRDYLIKTARQANYTADGLIFSLINGGTDKAVIIKFKENTTNKNYAKVNQYQGLYLFVDSDPLNETEYLGTIKNKMSLTSGQYTALREKLINRCKKDFKAAKGLILKLVNGGADTGDAIIFKK